MVRVTTVLSPPISVNVAILVMSFGKDKGVWQAFGGGQFLKKIRAFENNSPLITMAVSGISDPGFVYLIHIWYEVVRGMDGNSHSNNS